MTSRAAIAKTCCFTGHRAMSDVERLGVEPRLKAAVSQLVAQGYRYFAAGGALGLI